MNPTPPSSETVLFNRLRKGDAEAFDAIFRLFYADLVVTANRFLRNQEEAEDLVQDLFFKLWNNRKGLPENIGSVKGYLHRSARNRSLNVLRDQKRIPVDDAEISPHLPAAGLPSDGLTQDDLRQRINRAIDQLPERCRLVFTMSKLEGMSQREIAESLDISVKTVENQMTRAYRFLRRWLALLYLFSGPVW